MRPVIGCLGKSAPRIDARTLRLAPYLKQVNAPPFARDWTSAMPEDLGTFRNLEIGDCTIAATAHLQRAWSSAHSEPVVPSDADVLAAYSKITGYKPSDPSTDRGADMLTVLKHWRAVGIAGNRIRAFVKLDHDDVAQLMTAANLFGGLYVGAMLPRAAAAGQPWWTCTTRLDGEYKPGSWGGHCMALLGYSRLGVCFATWGRRQWATWQWFLSYCDEAYAVIDTLWVRTGVVAPNGLDLVALDRDLAVIGAA